MQVSEKDKAWIAGVIHDELPQARVVFFGSRVKGNAEKYSDLDVAVRCLEKIPLDVLSRLNEVFAQSDLPYKVDLVDYQRVDKEFREIIDQYETK